MEVAAGMWVDSLMHSRASTPMLLTPWRPRCVAKQVRLPKALGAPPTSGRTPHASRAQTGVLSPHPLGLIHAAPASRKAPPISTSTRQHPAPSRPHAHRGLRQGSHLAPAGAWGCQGPGSNPGPVPHLPFTQPEQNSAVHAELVLARTFAQLFPRRQHPRPSSMPGRLLPALHRSASVTASGQHRALCVHALP